MTNSVTHTRNPEQRMAKLVAIHGFPPDPVAYQAYYFESHVPLVRALPGLRRYEVSRGPVRAPEADSNIMLIAEMYFDSVEAAQTALQSAEGQKAVADIPNFAETRNIQILLFECVEL